MLTWIDTGKAAGGNAVPEVNYRDATGRWIVARLGQDPRLGWGVFEVRGGRPFRRVERAHLMSQYAAQAVAEVLDRGIIRYALFAAEWGLALATMVTVAWSRRWSGAAPGMGEPLTREPDRFIHRDGSTSASEGVRQVDPALLWSLLNWPGDCVVNPDLVREFVHWYLRMADGETIDAPDIKDIKHTAIRCADHILQRTPILLTATRDSDPTEVFADRLRRLCGSKPIAVQRPPASAS